MLIPIGGTEDGERGAVFCRWDTSFCACIISLLQLQLNTRDTLCCCGTYSFLSWGDTFFWCFVLCIRHFGNTLQVNLLKVVTCTDYSASFCTSCDTCNDMGTHVFLRARSRVSRWSQTRGSSRVRPGGVQKLADRVGSGQEVIETPWVNSGRVGRFSSFMGRARSLCSDPTSETRSDLRAKPCVVLLPGGGPQLRNFLLTIPGCSSCTNFGRVGVW